MDPLLLLVVVDHSASEVETVDQVGKLPELAQWRMAGVLPFVDWGRVGRLR